MSVGEKVPHLQGSLNLLLRKMRVGDVPAVTEIDREAFPTTWPHTPFQRELSNRRATYLVVEQDPSSEPTPLAPGTLAEARSPHVPGLFHRVWSNLPGRGRDSESKQAKENNVVGFVGTWLVSTESHITAIAAKAGYRSRGIGELLLIGAIELALHAGAEVVTLEVRVSNMVAQSLYQKYGFKSAGIRKRYYADNGEDALIMSTDLIHSAEYQRHFLNRVTAHENHWGYVRSL